MTEPAPVRHKPRRPAFASRILAIGASTAAAIGFVGAMAARQPAPPAAADPAAAASPRPIHVIVVIHRRAAAAITVHRPATVTQAPRIVRHYVAARKATTSTHGS
jgi:hypothetical protein